MTRGKEEIVGLVPAAGYARRISPLPCSKEIFPVGFTDPAAGSASPPKVVATYLLESFKAAGVEQIYMVIRTGKWDIPEYFNDGKSLDMNIAYLALEASPGTPFTVDQAFPFVRDKKVLFGFPDILFKPADSFKKLIQKQQETDADIVLGLFQADDPSKMDMVELDGNGQVQNLVIKPEKTDLRFTWIIAVWSPHFTNFLHEILEKHRGDQNARMSREYQGAEELYIGDVIQQAIDTGFKVESVKFSKGFYIDIGTAGDLRRALRFMMGDSEQ